MSNDTHIPQWAQRWDGEWRDLVLHVNEIGHDAEVADHLFASRQEAFDIGVAVGSTRRDLELRGLEAAQAETDAFRREMLGWLMELAATHQSGGQLSPRPPDQESARFSADSSFDCSPVSRRRWHPPPVGDHAP